jgi:hypothetical protein
VPARDILDIVLRVNAGAYAIEMANPRHEHEWGLWEDVALPESQLRSPAPSATRPTSSSIRSWSRAADTAGAARRARAADGRYRLRRRLPSSPLDPVAGMRLVERWWHLAAWPWRSDGRVGAAA